jgi:hypothetical protein
MRHVVQQTQQRVDDFRRLIRSIKQLSFPYDDSEAALEFADQAMVDQLAILRNQIQEDTSTEDAHQFCRMIMRTVSQFSAVLGLIAQSAEPVGAIELHGPLKALTQKAIDDKAHLVISSDWNYSPLTLIPPDFLSKHGVVLVGMPTAEANNVLLTPLAGHELGHNIWAKHSTVNKLSDLIWAKVQEFMKSIEASEEEFLDIAHSAQAIAEDQAEELFCDMIGLLMFREAYLHAFRFYLATDQDSTRDNAYPPVRRRAEILLECAKKRGITAIPEDFLDSFEQPVERPYDPISLACADGIWDVAVSFVDTQKLDIGSEAGTEKILDCFKQLVPACDVVSLQDVINAAWRFELDPECRELAKAQGLDRDTSLVSELAYKTCEIFQVEQTLKS